MTDAYQCIGLAFVDESASNRTVPVWGAVRPVEGGGLLAVLLLPYLTLCWLSQEKIGDRKDEDEFFSDEEFSAVLWQPELPSADFPPRQPGDVTFLGRLTLLGTLRRERPDFACGYNHQHAQWEIFALTRRASTLLRVKQGDRVCSASLMEAALRELEVRRTVVQARA